MATLDLKQEIATATLNIGYFHMKRKWPNCDKPASIEEWNNLMRRNAIAAGTADTPITDSLEEYTVKVREIIGKYNSWVKTGGIVNIAILVVKSYADHTCKFH